MAEAAEPEPDALHALDQVVDRLGGSVRHPGPVPRGDLVAPTHDRASELAHLGRAVLVLEVVAKPLDEGGGEVGVVDVVDASDGLFGMPGGADLASGVAGREQPWVCSPDLAPLGRVVLI